MTPWQDISSAQDVEKLIAELREPVQRIVRLAMLDEPHHMATSADRSAERARIAVLYAQEIHALYATALEGVMGENERLLTGGFTAKDGGQWVRKDTRDAAEARAERAEAALKGLVDESPALVVMAVREPSDGDRLTGWTAAMTRARAALSLVPVSGGLGEGDLAALAESAAAGPSACAATGPHSQSEEG